MARNSDELVARAKRGDERAFAELVQRYRPRIVALALHIGGRAAEAEDIAQDVFLRAFQRLSDFEGRSQFFTWVYRMAVNRALNTRRDRERRGEHQADDDPRIELALPHDSEGDPVRATELRRTYARLLAALDQMPTDMATSVVLVALQGFSHAETAAIQRCSIGTVSWRIHEARQRLRAAMVAAPKSRQPESCDLIEHLRALARVLDGPRPLLGTS